MKWKMKWKLAYFNIQGDHGTGLRPSWQINAETIENSGKTGEIKSTIVWHRPSKMKMFAQHGKKVMTKLNCKTETWV